MIELFTSLCLELEDKSGLSLLELDPAQLCITLDGSPDLLELSASSVLELFTGDRQGPPGPPGPSGAAGVQEMTATAGENLSALRVVKVFNGVASYVDLNTPADSTLVTGITRTSALLGASVVVQVGGEMADSSWSWAAGPIYVGAGASLSQSLVTSGFVCELARAIAEDRILVDVQLPILRS